MTEPFDGVISSDVKPEFSNPFVTQSTTTSFPVPSRIKCKVTAVLFPTSSSTVISTGLFEKDNSPSAKVAAIVICFEVVGPRFGEDGLIIVVSNKDERIL